MCFIYGVSCMLKGNIPFWYEICMQALYHRFIMQGLYIVISICFLQTFSIWVILFPYSKEARVGIHTAQQKNIMGHLPSKRRRPSSTTSTADPAGSEHINTGQIERCLSEDYNLKLLCDSCDS